jgi:hypothetical protein
VRFSFSKSLATIEEGTRRLQALQTADDTAGSAV